MMEGLKTDKLIGLGELSRRVGDLAGRHGWPAALADLQSKAALRVGQLPWPASDDEEWRRSPVADFNLDAASWGGLVPLGKRATALGFPAFLCQPADPLEPEACQETGVEDIAASLTVRMGTTASDWEVLGAGNLPGGLEFGILGVHEFSKSALAALGPLGEAGLSSCDNRFQAWNLSASDVVVYIYGAPEVEIAKDLVLDWSFDADSQVVQPLLLLHLGAHCRLRITERLASQGGTLLNYLRLVDLGPGSSLDHTLFQDCHPETVLVGHGHARMAQAARSSFNEAQLGAGWIKTRTRVDIEGEGGEALLDGIFFAHGQQHVDIRTVQNHLAPRAWSRARYKGVLKDQGRSVFQGMIHVAHQAVRTDAYLSNKNLILNDGARADSIPSLNIMTDDVKCSHGSTTGKLDPEQVYYLENRGFNPAESRNILVQGYLDEIASGFPLLVREAMGRLVRQRIQDGD